MFPQSLKIMSWGLITTAATVLLSAILEFKFFTLSIGIFLPIGAVITGIVAASGFYFGSIYFNKRPEITLLLQMVIFTAIAQISIYFFEYKLATLENGENVSNFISFKHYMSFILTNSPYSLGTGARETDIGTMGNFGYLIAVIQFIGFMLGGACIYLILRAKSFCEECNKYYKKVATVNKYFKTYEELINYQNSLTTSLIGSAEYFAAISYDCQLNARSKYLFCHESILHACPQCKNQILEEKTYQMDKKNIPVAIDGLSRKIKVQKNIPLIDLFIKYKKN